MLVLTETPELARAYEANVRAPAAQSHPYRRSTASTTPGKGRETEETHQPAPVDRAIRGNRDSKIYHLPQCPGSERLSPANITTFPTEKAAQQAGYRKAKNCP